MMQLIIFLAWLFGLLAIMAGFSLISSPMVDTRIEGFLKQHYEYLANKGSRKKFFDWLTVGSFFVWFLLFFYFLSLYLSNNPID